MVVTALKSFSYLLGLAFALTAVLDNLSNLISFQRYEASFQCPNPSTSIALDFWGLHGAWHNGKYIWPNHIPLFHHHRWNTPKQIMPLMTWYSCGSDKANAHAWQGMLLDIPSHSSSSWQKNIDVSPYRWHQGHHALSWYQSHMIPTASNIASGYFCYTDHSCQYCCITHK